MRFTDCSVLEECPGTVYTESLTWLQLINSDLVSHSPFPRQRCVSAKQPSNYKKTLLLSLCRKRETLIEVNDLKRIKFTGSFDLFTVRWVFYFYFICVES